MENNISLRPLPLPSSYMKQFQVAQRNFTLFVKEQRQMKRQRKRLTAAYN